MSELRWILIGFGVILLAAIYLWGRRGPRPVPSGGVVVRVRPEPALNHVAQPSFDEPAAHASDEDERDRIISEPAITAMRAAPVERSRGGLTAEEASTTLARPATSSDTWRGRVEPTFAESAPTEEMPVHPEVAAPTLSSSEAPQQRRTERRKILSLRLAAAPQRLDGARLLEVFQSESLQHGKYDIFHRMHEDGASIVFSVASMMEPGTFELEKTPSMQFPGVTLFAQLPGPAPGMHALNELVACARKLQQALGGTLQDERGVPLTVHRIERLRQEVREFERPSAARA